MANNPSSPIATQLRARMQELGITQQALARTLGRAQPRLSELLGSLDSGRLGKDRLALLLEVCEVLHLTLLPVPVQKAGQVAKLLGSRQESLPGASSLPDIFDEVFIDLSDDDDDDDDRRRHRPGESA